MELELWLASRFEPLSHSFLSPFAKGKKRTSISISRRLGFSLGPSERDHGAIFTVGSDA